jgi:putative glutamine amidotransferase
MNHASFILPVVANLGLTKQETTELHTEISEKFSMLVALGGDDVDPRFYKTKVTYARGLNTVRDRFEINLIKSYVTAEKGFLLGVSVLSTATSLLVNSYHHQAVIFREGGPLEIAARSADGVTEATEFKNGRGLLLQFHPELMDNDLGFEIIKKAVSVKDRALPLRCSRTFLN